MKLSAIDRFGGGVLGLLTGAGVFLVLLVGVGLVAPEPVVVRAAGDGYSSRLYGAVEGRLGWLVDSQAAERLRGLLEEAGVSRPGMDDPAGGREPDPAPGPSTPQAQEPGPRQAPASQPERPRVR
jgi:hypothetical protein